MQKNIVLWILISLPFYGISQDDWHLKKESELIKIYTRKSANSNLKEFKATTVINSSLDAILNELLEAPDYYKNCEPNVSYYVKALENNQHVFYAYKDLPWPVKDRDIVTLLTVEDIDSAKVKLTLEALPEGLPKKNNTIRVKKLMGHWLLEETNNQTMVTQQLFLDPEGNLPSFVINGLLIKGPYTTLMNLHKSISSIK